MIYDQTFKGRHVGEKMYFMVFGDSMQLNPWNAQKSFELLSLPNFTEGSHVYRVATW